LDQTAADGTDLADMFGDYPDEYAEPPRTVAPDTTAAVAATAHNPAKKRYNRQDYIRRIQARFSSIRG